MYADTNDTNTDPAADAAAVVATPEALTGIERDLFNFFLVSDEGESNKKSFICRYFQLIVAFAIGGSPPRQSGNSNVDKFKRFATLIGDFAEYHCLFLCNGKA